MRGPQAVARPKPRPPVPKPSLCTSPQTPGTWTLGTRAQMSPVSTPNLAGTPRGPWARTPGGGGTHASCGHQQDLGHNWQKTTELLKAAGRAGLLMGAPQHGQSNPHPPRWLGARREMLSGTMAQRWPNRSRLGTGSNNNKTAAWHLGFRWPTTTPVLPAAKPKPPKDAKARGPPPHRPGGK